jgi:hypothetical protein
MKIKNHPQMNVVSADDDVHESKGYLLLETAYKIATKKSLFFLIPITKLQQNFKYPLEWVFFLQLIFHWCPQPMMKKNSPCKNITFKKKNPLI